jgi:hypothetical protein
MSTSAMTDAESFYQFLGHTLSQGSRETAPEALLRQWREQREFEETCAAIQEGMDQLEAGLARPADEVFAEIRRRRSDRAS